MSESPGFSSDDFGLETGAWAKVGGLNTAGLGSALHVLLEHRSDSEYKWKKEWRNRWMTTI